MPGFLEKALRAEAAKQGLTGERANHYAYGGMNNLGAMHGNQETPKGRAMEKKHAHDVAHGKTRGKGRASNNVTRRSR